MHIAQKISIVKDTTLQYKTGKQRVLLLREIVQQTGRKDTQSLPKKRFWEQRKPLLYTYTELIYMNVDTISKYLYKTLANSLNILVQNLKVCCAQTVLKWWKD